MDWYEPGEDTYTLMDALEREGLEMKIVLDLGTSTGVITEQLRKRNTVVSTDLNIRALESHRGGNLVRADLLCSINQESVDVVVFNPPYVPDTDDPIIGGGYLGREVIDRFVDAVTVGMLYLLVIEANRPKEVLARLEERGYGTRILKVRKILGETVYIIKGEKS
ncbi:N6 ADENINE SPECIFIC DNA METHYLASE (METHYLTRANSFERASE SUPERFAMILY) [Encephalitozoon cuniculi GB-M1]|uniref:N6 ADENINE SPECIFIC DNA METHYLASE (METHYLTRANSFERASE SUPERFAMILY) n=2 Tax=Encephalitozoon cuniculi TaxID=6035 RepID=Q8SRR4_ENCCU|nr:S-adenosylmethionine-dependent methyltransferase [Encephalitozoon cuniculi GB-M1]AGE95755.1 n6 adenine specific DNA methylase [Encephalitozoon cuniculi]KMV65957.1 putative HemK-like methylase [Encephalitozoon cuniculi EcunIII-L]UYI27653.1 methyltransferase [Encephalitozoon cuniculi]CAD25421.1 N6 ADENINE SPECIFIC DNA METHYLASE (METHYLTRANSFERASE SUPERFAMILY) [Encephalitozoon cuniculi GB-M1]